MNVLSASKNFDEASVSQVFLWFNPFYLIGFFFMNDQTPLILVDGSSYLYRAFHALPALINSKGFPTGAIFGITSMLKRLITDYQPLHMAVIFDTKGETFRDGLYPAYKATRKEMPPELAQQIEPIHGIIRALGLPLIAIEGIEADDIIGTLATRAAKENIPCLISTGDKDLAQLVNKHITLINTMTQTLLDVEGVQLKFGVPPNRIIDYLTLMGDSSDNIPGVPQVGPKTAVKWLQTYHSLDNIIAHADEIKGKVGDNLRAFLSQLPLTRSLVTIQCDLNIPFNLSDLAIQSADHDQLINYYKEMEFKTWLSELLEQKKDNANQHAHYQTIITEKNFQQWIHDLEHAEIFALDTETTSLDYMNAKLVGISFAISPSHAAYVPFGHDYENAPTQLKKEDVLATLKPILENPLIKKIGQNIKYDMEVLANEGIQLKGIAYDTMLESYILDSASNRHDMDSLALKYLGERTITFEEVAGKGSKQLSFNQVTLEKASVYAAEDADVTLRLHQLLWPRIQSEKKLHHVFENIEMPIVSILAAMERHGVLIDPKKLALQGKELTLRLKELEQSICAISGENFNINSPKQLQEILFNKLKLPILQKTPTGIPSTADAVLQELAIDFELPRLIIEYRSLSKLISTYTNRLIEQINPITKRVHTSYNQTGAATGRLSSSNPNLQNIPIRSKEGRRIRQAFIAPSHYKIVSADYSQIELRLMAHISEDPNLIHAFMNHLDIHKATAAEVWGVSLNDVTPEMRRDAKAINFGLLYGMSAFGLTRQLGIDRKAAQAYIDQYFIRYPNVKKYMDETKNEVKEKGYVETLWGRRLYLPDIHASQIPRQNAALRAAINAPLQGSAADLIKMAMITIHQWIKDEGIRAAMTMQVHDELVFEVHEADLQSVIVGIKKRMVDIVSLQVPLLVSVGVGDNWDEASQH